MRRVLATAIALGSLIAAVILGVATFRRIEERPRTDDAFLAADIVHMAPDVGGRIVELHVVDNQLVEKGETLFVIDPEPYRFRVAEAEGKIRQLEAMLANQTTEIAAQRTRAAAARTAIVGADAQLALASQTRRRLEPLARPGFISKEQLDHAKPAEKTAQTTLDQRNQQALEAEQQIVSTQATEAELAIAKVSLQSAQRDLRLTTVRAPCRGRITSLSVAAGEYGATGKAVFTIISTRRWRAVGNFKETDLSRVAVGDRAEVFVMVDPSHPLSGTITDKGFGVSPQEDQSVGGLPSVPRSLNWVRIAQRFPVRILLDDPPPDLMRVGSSVAIVVQR